MCNSPSFPAPAANAYNEYIYIYIWAINSIFYYTLFTSLDGIAPGVSDKCVEHDPPFAGFWYAE